MKEIDDTTPPKNETEDLETICALLYPQVSAFMEMEMHRIMERIHRIVERMEALEVQIADLEHSRRVGRHPPTDQDPEWYA